MEEVAEEMKSISSHVGFGYLKYPPRMTVHTPKELILRLMTPD